MVFSRGSHAGSGIDTSEETAPCDQRWHVSAQDLLPQELIFPDRYKDRYRQTDIQTDRQTDRQIDMGFIREGRGLLVTRQI